MNKKKENGEGNDLNVDINSDENQSGISHLNEPVNEESLLERTQSDLNDLKDKYLRKVAEFENFKRRNAKEKVELIQTAGKEVIVELLDVLDDCDRAQKELEMNDNTDQS